MKKTYQTPQMACIKVQPQQLLQASELETQSTYTQQTSGNLSRGNRNSDSDWDDD